MSAGRQRSTAQSGQAGPPAEPAPAPAAPAPASPAPPAAPRQRLPVWKKLLFAAVTCAGFFALLELVLLVCGVRPILYDDDPYVGFASQVPLFVEQTGADGAPVMATARNKRQFFNDQQFPRDKGDRVRRIFCLGGSTTFGRPYDDTTSFCGWLRELLAEADPSRRWEVVNAGGISYASYRVAALMEELARYEPDLFVVYCGHNEFLERRTYAGIIETPAPLRGLGAFLGRTRTYAVMSRLVEAFRSNGTDGGQRPVLPGEVETLLEQSVGPDQYTRDDALREQVLAHYRYNLARMVRIARAAGAEVIFVAPAANLRSASPFKSLHRDGLGPDDRKRFQALVDRAETAFRAGRLSEALTAADRAGALDDRYAHLHYLRARVLDGLKRYGQAKAAYQRAVDEDICPLRVLSPMREALADVAGERDAPLVDFAALVEAASPQGIPGTPWFLDHVHPTIRGHRMLAVALVNEMAKAQLVSPGEAWPDAVVEKVTRLVEGRIDRRKHGYAMRNVAQVMSWAGKTEDAYDAAVRAVEMAPKDAEANYLLASLAQNLGKADQAIRHYQILLRSNLDPAAAPYLANAHHSYGSILAWQGKFDLAARHLRKALALKPDYPQAAKKLSEVLLEHGRRLIRAGRAAQGLQMLRDLVRSHGDSAEARDAMGGALLNLGRAPEAIAEFRKAIALDATCAAAHNNLGVALGGQGNLKDAETCFRRALEIRPDYRSAQQNLDRLLKHKARRP